MVPSLVVKLVDPPETGTIYGVKFILSIVKYIVFHAFVCLNMLRWYRFAIKLNVTVCASIVDEYLQSASPTLYRIQLYLAKLDVFLLTIIF